jgi:ABC-type glutathione transport system ATPase component
MTPLLSVRGLRKSFAPRGRGDDPVLAVDDVDLDLAPGEVLGLVGESGSGKTTLGKLLLRIIEPDAGSIRFAGDDLRALDARALRSVRGQMQMIYQAATACLNPGLTVNQHLRETIALHRRSELDRADALIEETLAAFRLEGKGLARPRELSGGERRRVGVARCLLPKPRLVVADEPTAGLDASVKAEVLELMLGGRDPEQAWLFISHELDIVRFVADRILVMYRGRIVQELPAERLDPRHPGGADDLHPYTERLLRSALTGGTEPVTVPRRERSRGGCPYRPECHRVDPSAPLWQRCTEEVPEPVRPGGTGRISCHLLTDPETHR